MNEQDLTGTLAEDDRGPSVKKSAVVDIPQAGPLRMAWERLRDICYVVQASRWFDNLTTLVIIMNSAILAVVWYVL